MNVTVPDQRNVLRCYGADVQAQIHMEELGELIQAISKLRRAEREERDRQVARAHLVEEMADVYICLEQLTEIYEVRNWELQYEIHRNCIRQEERMYQRDS